MTEPFGRLRRFLRELKRRNVYKVAVTYAAVVFVGLQAVRLLVPATTLPGWADELLIAFAVLGFPIAIVLAWAFEMTPEGMRRTETAEGEESVGAGFRWIGLALVVALAGGVWYATAEDSGESGTESTATRDTAQTTEAPVDRAASRDRPFVAVLPLENLSPDEENAFFADGIHEEILTQLSKVSGLGVKSRTSVLQYEDTEKTMEEIARELTVDALMEGSVRRSGERVRITAQLIDGESGDHLWSNTYERALSPEAVFDIQADIAEEIAGSLETQLAGGERQRIESAPTENLAAYEAFLRGRNHLSRWRGRWEPTLVDKAIASLREAVRRDSTFAPAHAWLARAFLGQRRAAPAEEHPRWMDSASAALERARRINPDLASVHEGQAVLYSAQDSLAAETQAYRRALKVQPSNAFAKTELSENLVNQGEYVEAVRVAREAVRLDPRWPWVLQEMADQVRIVGLYDAAEAWNRHILEIDPGYFGAFNGLAHTQLQRGEPDRALKTWQGFLRQTDSPPPDALFFAADASLAAGQPQQALSYLERLGRRLEERRDRPARGPDPFGVNLGPFGSLARVNYGFAQIQVGQEKSGRAVLQREVDSLRDAIERGEEIDSWGRFALAGALAALGQQDQAVEQLGRAREAGDYESGPGALSFHPIWDSLRSDPRFQDILRAAKRNQNRLRQKVLEMDIDLYPPGAEPDSAVSRTQTNG